MRTMEKANMPQTVIHWSAGGQIHLLESRFFIFNRSTLILKLPSLGFPIP